MGNGEDLFRVSYRTPWGMGVVSVSGGRLLEVELPERGVMPVATETMSAAAEGPTGTEPEGPATGEPSKTDVADAAEAERWVADLEAYFRGERLAWKAEEVPLDDLGLGAFEQRVYRALLSVPPAVTVSYGTLAELAGYPRAARAVGNAMAANPIPIVIPCHRVVRSDGSLGRYGKDPSWKPRLLEHEAAHVGRVR